MKKANNDLRLLCKGNGIPLWKVAVALGISDQTLYRNWRTPLPPEDKEKVIFAINELKSSQEEGDCQ